MEQNNKALPADHNVKITAKEWDRVSRVQEAVVLLYNELFRFGFSVNVSVFCAYKHMTLSLFRDGEICDSFNFFFDNRFVGNDFNAAIDKIAEWQDKYGGSHAES